MRLQLRRMEEVMSEFELVAAAREGDSICFEALVHLYEKRVYHLALRLCGNSEDARDAAQEAFVSAWQGLPRFRQEAAFSTWLFRLTTNACIDLLRRENRNRGNVSLDEWPQPLAGKAGGREPEQVLEQQLLGESIRQGLAALPPNYRQVLVLRELEQLSYEEIAQILTLDLGTVKSRISRGRRLLQTFLCQNGNFWLMQASKATQKPSKGGAAL